MPYHDGIRVCSVRRFPREYAPEIGRAPVVVSSPPFPNLMSDEFDQSGPTPLPLTSRVRSIYPCCLGYQVRRWR